MWSQFIKQKLKNEYTHDQLIDELYRQMFIVAYAKVRNKMEALDIVQESWVKILRKIDTLKDSDKIFQWAKVIVSNTALNLLKKQKAMAEYFFHDIHLEQRPNVIQKYDLEDRVFIQELYQEIRKFDEITRKMFYYKFAYGWKDQQIADHLNMPVGTVKARLHRSKEKIRNRFL